METSRTQDAVTDRLVAWATSNEDIRALLLYSSRADPAAPVDRFSDYDVLVLVRDEAAVRRYHEQDGWLEDFGRVMVVFRNPVSKEYGFDAFGFITHYADGVKIDYSFFPVAFLEWQACQPRLVDDLDNGYLVLLDKDGSAARLPAPTGRAHLTPPPAEREYRELVETFFNDACYVAKCLWRDDLFLAKHCLDEVMKNECLRVMLEWQVKAQVDWAIRTGAHGKGLKKRVDPATWAALERTYVGAGFEENWQALFQTIDLFRHVAKAVGTRLGYAYPEETDSMVTDYLNTVRRLGRGV